MTYLDAAILGIVQGLTEFLPVSSSGHLVLGQEILNRVNGNPEALTVHADSLSFEIILHLGTLIATLVFFRKLIARLIHSVFDPQMVEDRRLVMYVILGTIPAALAGLFIKSHLPGVFSSVTFVSVALLFNGAILISTAYISQSRKEFGIGRTLAVGVAQAVAILPGISRSGSTISAALHLGISPQRAAEFSFMLAIPAILGAVVLDLDQLGSLEASQVGIYATGAALAFFSGLLAVGWLMRLIRRGKFIYFGVYCLALGAVSLLAL